MCPSIGAADARCGARAVGSKWGAAEAHRRTGNAISPSTLPRTPRVPSDDKTLVSGRCSRGSPAAKGRRYPVAPVNLDVPALRRYEDGTVMLAVALPSSRDRNRLSRGSR